MLERDRGSSVLNTGPDMSLEQAGVLRQQAPHTQCIPSEQLNVEKESHHIVSFIEDDHRSVQLDVVRSSALWNKVREQNTSISMISLNNTSGYKAVNDRMIK